MKPMRPIAAKSAPAAYRADAAGRPHGFGGQDGTWIAVASILDHAARAETDDRLELCTRAHAMAKEAMERLGSQHTTSVEWRGRTLAGADFVVALADQAYEAGALNTSAAILGSLLNADESMTPLQRGIALSRLARANAKLGLMDVATDQYTAVAHFGRENRTPELEVRGWIGLGSMAQQRGNYPEMREWSERACTLAEREGLTGLSRMAHNGLMVWAGIRQRFDDALVHGWAAFRASAGDPIAEAEVLQNLGQLLLESGHTAEAHAAFAAVLAQRLPVRIVLAALGGLARTSAAASDRETVAWAASEVERLGEMPVPRHYLAYALLECATAAARVGDARTTRRLQQRATRIAEAHGFNEVAIRAEQLLDAVPATADERQAPLSQDAAEIVERVKWMAPERLPDHVLVGAAPE